MRQLLLDARELLLGSKYERTQAALAKLDAALSMGEWHEKYAKFGKAFCEKVLEHGESWWGDEWSEDVMPLMVEEGLATKEPYNPEVHHFDCEAEPGDEIWVISTPPDRGAPETDTGDR